jgi:hypothetical protein
MPVAKNLRAPPLLVAALFALPSCSDVTGYVPPSSDGGVCGAGGPTADAGKDDDAGVGCPGDTDGIIGGCYAFDLTVDDSAFAPIILKAQNRAQVNLTLRNTGTKPHGFVLDCIPTPNTNGCPSQSCFAAGSTIGPLPPGGTASTTFVTPNPEGIYNFHSEVAGDSQTESDGGMAGLWGQFVVQ